MPAASGEVTIRFFARMKEVFGQKEASLDGERASTVEEALRALCATPERERVLFAASGALRTDIIVLRNGRNIAFLGGLQTVLEGGDAISVFPPLQGG